ncbi:phosphatase PAP2 family protein [Cellvibrio sp. ARAG 10.3]|uniref:phosphatase PAP2 family protein n=1 Tax=Cellvibrio sp. ARAG 10.3 TaxID=3451358 RepID=UPI003F476249
MNNLPPADPGSQGRIAGMLQWLGSHELPVLLAFCTILASLWGFAELAEEVIEGDTHEFDQALLLSMRNPADLSDPIGPGWVEEIGRDITALGGNAVLTLLTLAVVGYLLLDGKRRMALVLVVATLGALGVSTLLKNTIDRERPDLVPHHTQVYTASFPSGHSMLSASTYLTMGALLARVQRRKRMKAYILLVAIIATLLVGLSRIYLGVHWPTDVLAGWTAGAAWAIGCWLLARWLQRRHEVEDEDSA